MRVAVLLGGLLVVAGCGGGSDAPPPAHAAKAPLTRCTHSGHASEAIGWTLAGFARVRLAEQIWRGKTLLHGPGVYLVDPRTMRARLERASAAMPGC